MEQLKTRVMFPKQDPELLESLAKYLGVKPIELRVFCPFLGMPFTTVEDFKNNMRSLYLRRKVTGYPPIYFKVRGGILAFRGSFMEFPEDFPWAIATKKQVIWVLLKDDGSNRFFNSLEEMMELFDEKSKLDAWVKAVDTIVKTQGGIEVKLK